MRILVDEIPLTIYDCPFSKEAERYERGRYCSSIVYECSVTKELCDLNCDTCSGLKVIE